MKSKFFNDFFSFVKYSSPFFPSDATSIWVLSQIAVCYQRQHTCMEKHSYKKLCIMKRNSSFRLLSVAECLKTKMSLFFHFLLFYDTIDDEKKGKKSSIRKYVQGDERMKKSLKIMRKQFFVFMLMYSLCRQRALKSKKNQYSLCLPPTSDDFALSLNHHRNLYQCLKFFGLPAFYVVIISSQK